jgi:glycosyltransferase involved in cell wall biosynthesis
MNLWYLNHYATEPSYGQSGRPNFIAASLTKRGHQVLVVGASDHHLRATPVPEESLWRPFSANGARYLFLKARAYRGNNLGRTLNMLDYARGLTHLRHLVAEGILEKPDVVIASSAHLFHYPKALRLARSLGAGMIFEVRDLWPLSLVEVADLHQWHPLVKVMDRVERKAYRTADAVVSLLPHALAHMEQRGLQRQRFYWIPNGVWAEEWHDKEASPRNELCAELWKTRAEGKLVVVYTGAHGPPNALGQILDMARIPATERPYHFFLVGDGIEKTLLQERATREACDFVTFFPQVSKEEARAVIRAADVCFLGWQDRPIYRFGISANKLFEYMMAGMPILHALSQAHDPVSQAGAGIVVPACAPRELDVALRQFAVMSPSERNAMGERGRAYVLRNYEWSVLGERYEAVCHAVSAKRHSRRFAPPRFVEPSKTGIVA